MRYQTNPGLEVHFAAIGGWAPSTVREYGLSLQLLARKYTAFGLGTPWEEVLGEECLRVVKLHQTGGGGQGIVVRNHGRFYPWLPAGWGKNLKHVV